MTKDPVCRMNLSEDRAPEKMEYKGDTYYFCGLGCRKRFEKDPDKYLNDGPIDWVGDA